MPRWNIDKKPQSCTECDKSFASKWDLKLHVRVHTGEKTIHAQNVTNLLRGNGILSCMQEFTQEKKPFLCTVCDTSLKSSGSLIVHMRGHSGEKPFICQTCGKDFNQRSNFRVHIKSHIKWTTISLMFFKSMLSVFNLIWNIQHYLLVFSLRKKLWHC